MRGKIFFIIPILSVLLFIRNAMNAQWTKTFKPNGDTVTCFTVHNGNIFAGTRAGGVFVSTNNGMSWAPANNGLTDLHIKSLASGGAYIFAGTNLAGIFRFTDNGNTWTPKNNGLSSLEVNTIYLDDNTK
ncbi:MAG: hypothetical protein HY707_14535, partial [Ignavibacteriae bacterium]|nr:hypothetical protein [Ignavibacteriota bacterium]